MIKKLPKLIVILGPTASGKTELAIKLAKKLDGEIVSADSRQVYKEMNIGTAKPTEKELKNIPYFLINVINPDKDFNAAIYKNLAVRKIKAIIKKDKIPFLVGGTGLYIKAVVDNIIFPEIPAQKKLRKEMEKKTAKELFKIYKELDVEGSKLIDKKNKRRLIRAIEVCRLTGKSFWQQRKRQKPIFDVLEIGIKINKRDLKERIRRRTKKMVQSGLEKEAKKLYQKYGEIPPLKTIGYQEFNDYFKGLTKNKEVESLINLHTLQFVKRQMTWFKKDKGIRWIKSKKEAEELIRQFLE